MSRSLIVLVVVVDLAALAAVALLPATGLAEHGEAVLLLMALAALVGARPVRLPSLRVNMTATHPLVICTLAAVGPAAAVLVNLAGLLGAAKGRGRRPLAAHFLFNAGLVTLCTAVAWWTFRGLGGRTGAEAFSLVWPLFGATAVYFALSTTLVAAAISVEKKRPFPGTWLRSCLWTVSPLLSGLPFALALLAAMEASLFWVVLITLPFSALLVGFYRGHAAARPDRGDQRPETDLAVGP
jgi:hypothetical protein